MQEINIYMKPDDMYYEDGTIHMFDVKCIKCKSSDIKIHKLGVEIMPDGPPVNVYNLQCNGCLETYKIFRNI